MFLTDKLFHSAVNQFVLTLENKYPHITLQEAVEPDRGISYGIVQTGAPVPNGVPTLRAGDLQQFVVDLNNVKRVDPAIESKYRRTRLTGIEVLLRIRGGLGEVATCPTDMVGGNVSREIAVIPTKENLLPKYVMFVLSSPSKQKEMRSKLRGTSYVGINLKDVRRLTIPLPPISEQNAALAKFNDIFERMTRIKNLQNNVTDEIAFLLQSILNKAFRGELV